jgi:hypothetical protein
MYRNALAPPSSTKKYEVGYANTSKPYWMRFVVGMSNTANRRLTFNARNKFALDAAKIPLQ